MVKHDAKAADALPHENMPPPVPEFLFFPLFHYCCARVSSAFISHLFITFLRFLSASYTAHADSSGARRVYAGQRKTMRAVFWGSYLTGST
jgi:hypothetical protein